MWNLKILNCLKHPSCNPKTVKSATGIHSSLSKPKLSLHEDWVGPQQVRNTAKQTLSQSYLLPLYCGCKPESRSTYLVKKCVGEKQGNIMKKKLCVIDCYCKKGDLKYPNVGFKSGRLNFYEPVAERKFLASLTHFQNPP